MKIDHAFDITDSVFSLLDNVILRRNHKVTMRLSLFHTKGQVIKSASTSSLETS